MSSETIPEWAYAQAIEFVANLTDSLVQPEQVEPIALALLAAEQRGRKAGLEEAAEVVAAMLPNLPPDGPDGPIQESEYMALGHALAAIRSLGEKI